MPAIENPLPAEDEVLSPLERVGILSNDLKNVLNNNSKESDVREKANNLFDFFQSSFDYYKGLNIDENLDVNGIVDKIVLIWKNIIWAVSRDDLENLDLFGLPEELLSDLLGDYLLAARDRVVGSDDINFVDWNTHFQKKIDILEAESNRLSSVDSIKEVRARYVLLDKEYKKSLRKYPADINELENYFDTVFKDIKEALDGREDLIFVYELTDLVSSVEEKKDEPGFDLKEAIKELTESRDAAIESLRESNLGLIDKREHTNGIIKTSEVLINELNQLLKEKNDEVAEAEKTRSIEEKKTKVAELITALETNKTDLNVLNNRLKLNPAMATEDDLEEITDLVEKTAQLITDLDLTENELNNELADDDAIAKYDLTEISTLIDDSKETLALVKREIFKKVFEIRDAQNLVDDLKTLSLPVDLTETDPTKVFEVRFNGNDIPKDAARAKIDEYKIILDGLNTLSNEDHSEEKQQHIDNLIEELIGLIDLLKVEVDNFLPNIKEVQSWLNRLIEYCSGSPAKELNKVTFSTVNLLSDELMDVWKKWDMFSSTQVADKEAQGVKIDEDFKLHKDMMMANGQFFNFYFDVGRPDGGVNQTKIKDKTEDTNLEFGPLKGGVQEVKRMMTHFGITRPESYFSNEQRKRYGFKEDFADVVRRETLSYLHGNYVFVEDKGAEGYFASKETKDISFFYGNMGGRNEELYELVMTGKIIKGDREFVPVKASDVRDELNKSIYETPEGAKILNANSRKIHKGLNERSDWHYAIEEEKKKYIFDNGKGGKVDDDIVRYTYNFLKMSILDIAFIGARAKGSSVAQGAGLTIGDIKIDTLADLLSPAAKVGYMANNKPLPNKNGRLLMLYKAYTYEAASNGGNLPAFASSTSSFSVTEKTYNYIKYFLARFKPGVLLGEEGRERSDSDANLKIRHEQTDFFQQLDTESSPDRAFFHFDFNPEVGTEYDETVINTEFPDLATALLRGYVDSVPNYYTAAAGFAGMIDLVSTDIPDEITEGKLRELLGNVLSKQFGTYKIVKNGANQDMIKKIYRVYAMNVLNSYDGNTTNKFIRATSSKAESAVMELILPIMSATTVKGMVDEKDAFALKTELIFDMYTSDSIKNWENEFRNDETFAQILADHLDDTEEFSYKNHVAYINLKDNYPYKRQVFDKYIKTARKINILSERITEIPAEIAALRAILTDRRSTPTQKYDANIEIKKLNTELKRTNADKIYYQDNVNNIHQEIARSEFRKVLESGGHPEERMFNYIKEANFEVHSRYYKSEREEAKLRYKHEEENMNNAAANRFARAARKARQLGENLGLTGPYKLEKARAPESHD